MRLEHLNIVVRDLEETLKFYQAAFPHWYVRDGGEQDWYGVQRSWIHFGDDFQFITFNDNGKGESLDTKQNLIGIAHFAFVTNNLAALEKRLAYEGFDFHHRGQENEHRANVYYIDPNGFEVEFVQYFSDIPSERNN